MSRVWDQHRRAYEPRFWPLAVFGFALGSGLVSLIATVLPWWLALPLSLPACYQLGRALAWLRWTIWEHRHPERPCGPLCALHGHPPRSDMSAEYVESQREVAPWQ